MSDPSWNEAVARAQVNMRAPRSSDSTRPRAPAKRTGGFALLLDGRIARTPAKRKLIAPTRALAEAIAVGMGGAGRDRSSRRRMPLTRLAHSALDGVAGALEATIAEIAAYAGSDLVCYRAAEPEALAARQAAAFDPVLAFAEEALGARFALAGGIIHVPQPEASLQAVRGAIPRRALRGHGAARADEPLRLRAHRACGRARRDGAEAAWRRRISTRISRSSAGAPTRRRWAAARRDGATSPPPPSRSRRCGIS